MWCDDCSEEIGFDQIHDGPNGEWLCSRCIKKPEWQPQDEHDEDESL